MITCSHTTCEHYRKNRTSHCFIKQATVKNCERRIEAKNRKRRGYMKKYMRLRRKEENQLDRVDRLREAKNLYQRRWYAKRKAVVL